MQSTLYRTFRFEHECFLKCCVGFERTGDLTEAIAEVELPVN